MYNSRRLLKQSQNYICQKATNINTRAVTSISGAQIYTNIHINSKSKSSPSCNFFNPSTLSITTQSKHTGTVSAIHRTTTRTYHIIAQLLPSQYQHQQYHQYQYRSFSNMSETNATTNLASANANVEQAQTSKDNSTDNNHKQNRQGKYNKKRKGNNRWAWAKKRKDKKRAQQDGEDNNDSGSDGEQQQQQRKKNNRKPTDITWSSNPKELNAGSFAHPNMQKLYDVHVDMGTSATSTASEKNDTEKTETEPTTENETKTSTTNTTEKEADDTKDTTSPTQEGVAVAATEQVQEEEEIKLPKRKVALFIGFIGTKYNGMQMNKDQRTIQAEIELALHKAKLIAVSNFGYPNKYSWSSSARTDKGVHSCAQVCSVKILVPSDNMEYICSLMNEHLPDDIVILDVKRVARSFVAKTARDKVRYQYMLPSFVLQDYQSTQQLLRSINTTSDNDLIKDWTNVTKEEVKTIREQLKSYRVPSETLQKLKDTLNQFAGTHKFHNYTSRKDSQDDSARRYIHSFTVLDTVIDKDGMEWISTGVVGQSFLLHQIRKMISMTIDVTRGAMDSDTTTTTTTGAAPSDATPTTSTSGSDKEQEMDADGGDDGLDIMEESFTPKYMSINVAPAQGLFLEMSYFDNYNKRALGKGEDLDWHSQPDSNAMIRWKKFKEEKVMKHVMEEDERENNFIRYLFMQELHLKHVRYESTKEKKQTTYK